MFPCSLWRVFEPTLTSRRSWAVMAISWFRHRTASGLANDLRQFYPINHPLYLITNGYSRYAEPLKCTIRTRLEPEGLRHIFDRLWILANGQLLFNIESQD